MKPKSMGFLVAKKENIKYYLPFNSNSAQARVAPVVFGVFLQHPINSKGNRK
jgi:hypothetical protein